MNCFGCLSALFEREVGKTTPKVYIQMGLKEPEREEGVWYRFTPVVPYKEIMITAKANGQ